MFTKRLILVFGLGPIYILSNSLLIHRVHSQRFECQTKRVLLILLIFHPNVDILHLYLQVIQNLQDQPGGEPVLLLSTLLLQPFGVSFQYRLFEVSNFPFAAFHEFAVPQLPFVFGLVPQHNVGTIDINLRLAGG